MTTRTKDGASPRNGTPSLRTDISVAFWACWLLAAMAGEIAGHALNHVYFHRSGRVIVAMMLCFIAMSILRGVIRRRPLMVFWSAAFLLSLLGAVLAEASDISMGVGDIGTGCSFLCGMKECLHSQQIGNKRPQQYRECSEASA